MLKRGCVRYTAYREIHWAITGVASPFASVVYIFVGMFQERIPSRLPFHYRFADSAALLAQANLNVRISLARLAD